MIAQSEEIGYNAASTRLEVLRHRINDEDYLHAAIQRLALVLSKELMDVTKAGNNGRKWKGQK